MPRFRKRRRTAAPEPGGDAASAAAADGGMPGDLRAFALSLPEYQALFRVIEHARSRLEACRGGDAETIRNASGAELLPLLLPRAGAAFARGADGVPMLVSEIRHLEAAVVNLESYGGHETVLCDGYALLDRLDVLKGRTETARAVDGVLTLGQRTPPATSL
ncbi:hypothetical protein [Streptomyces bungoensis]|uniref:hypothetical protein n=1 Tax=Streptomyces bungoensis TaxID=285568 RepID=UPI000A64057B|nr:hypothetical protein [Streptomyces bungoensis]